MTLANSIADHLISFDSPAETSNLYSFPEGDPGVDALELAQRQIADLQVQLKAAEESAEALAQQKVEEFVKAKDEELQTGLNEIKATYDENIGQLTEQLQAQVLQHNKDLAEQVITWCGPVLRTLSTKRCMADLVAALEMLLGENCQMTVSGPEHLLKLIEPHLANMPVPSWSMSPTEGTEITITAGDTQVESCLEDWLREAEGRIDVS